jgi:outer membrane protein assembly factor BamD
MSKKLVQIFAIAVIIILSSCSGYEKVLKSNNYEEKYQFANKLFRAEKYQKAIRLYEQLVPLYRGTDKAADVVYYTSHAYYRSEDYTMAGYYFGMFVRDFARDSRAIECEFLQAYCAYKLSPNVELEQSATRDAITGFTLFISRHPGNPKSKEAQGLIKEMRDKLIEKDFMNAELYYKLSDYKAAIVSLRNSIQEYPETKYREEILFLLVKSSYLLAEKSIESKKQERYQKAIDEYYSFIGEFPESKKAAEAKRMHESATKALSKYKSSNL